MVDVRLAADLGYGIPWLQMVLLVATLLAIGFFIYVIISTRSKHALFAGFDKAKYELNKFHTERYWPILVGGLLIWFWFLGYPWMPPVASQEAIENPEQVHTIKVTAGQWYWQIEDGDNPSGQSPVPVNIKAGETVKFVARSLDVNHGFGILSSSNSMDSPMMQMQVVPGYDNIFYFTFDKPGIYTIRCLEYCGWNHPYMVSQLTVHAA